MFEGNKSTYHQLWYWLFFGLIVCLCLITGFYYILWESRKCCSDGLNVLFGSGLIGAFVSVVVKCCFIRLFYFSINAWTMKENICVYLLFVHSSISCIPQLLKCKHIDCIVYSRAYENDGFSDCDPPSPFVFVWFFDLMILLVVNIVMVFITFCLFFLLFLRFGWNTMTDWVYIHSFI